MSESDSIKAIQLTRSVFESVHGNIGLLKFNIEELTPISDSDNEEPKKWKVICSFFETLGSSAPSRYEVSVDLTTNTVAIKKLSGTESKKLDGTEWIAKETRKS